MIKRREVITLLGGVAAWPRAARSQQRSMRVIGVLHITSPSQGLMAGLHQGLGEAGFIEGRNVAMMLRLAEGQAERLPALAQDLVQRGVDIIVTIGGSVSTRAASAATATIPIVFMIGDVDPVEAGLVQSISRPGGNLTGISLLAGALGPKRVEILCELVPDAGAIAALTNPNNVNSTPHANEVMDAIRAAGRRAVLLRAASASDLYQAFENLGQQRADALIVTADNVFTRAARELVALAARHRIPAIYQWREFVVAGGLVSYGASLKDTAREAGLYTGRILKGAVPAELPVVQATRFELVINLKTAKALGVTVPPSLLARADEMIE